MDIEILLTIADPAQMSEVQALLKKSKLPFEDIDKHFHNFVCAFRNNSVIGVIGIEEYGTIALLRSFAVDETCRNKGIGLLLLNKLVDISKKKNIKEMYLLTTTARDYFSKHGFTKIDRNVLPPEIKATGEFNSLCPVSAICMRRTLA
jgi:amino-acid N-acetyltransferase